MKMKKIRILLAGGGTGGHIYTLIAVAGKLRSISKQLNIAADLRYFGDAGEYAIQLQSEGIRVKHVTSSKLRRYFSLLNIVDLFRFIWSIPQALWKVFWYMPDVVFSKGGPGALPVLYAARFYRVPIVIHDSDAVPGLTSRASGKFAKRILLAFAEASKYFDDPGKTAAVGNPVRDEVVLSEEDKSVQGAAFAKRKLKCLPEVPLILVLGGSQGAQRINRFILENLTAFLGKYQVLHQVGVGNYPDYMDEYLKFFQGLSDEQKERYKPVPFLHADMKLALQAADIVISRAGAGAIFEIAAAEKPAILIPLAESANNHQVENAFAYSAAGACVVVQEENLIGNLMLRQVDEILADPARLKKMRESARIFYKPNATEDIVKQVLGLVVK